MFSRFCKIDQPSGRPNLQMSQPFLLLTGDDKNLLTGPGVAKPGGAQVGDVALAVGGGPQKAQVMDPPTLHSARPARGLAEDHDALADRPQARCGPAA